MKEFEELFYKDPYCQEFDAKVLSCTPAEDGFDVLLSDTAFYPEGGGQPSDIGTLDDAHVLHVSRTGDGVVHHADRALEVNSSVHGAIDWNVRFDHMQQHSGEHIMSGLIHHKFGYENVGFHMGPDVTLIDFDGTMTWEQIKEIELEANGIVWRNEVIEAAFPTAEERTAIPYRSKKELSGDVRIVTIPNADVCACCGTHVSRTGEIGLIKALSAVRHHNGTRIELVCGRRAYFDDVEKTDAGNRIMNLLSCRRYETAEAVERLQNSSLAKDRTINAMADQTLKIKADTYPAGGSLIIDEETGIDINALRSFCTKLIKENKAETAAVLFAQGSAEDQINYLIMSNVRNLKEDARVLNEQLNGRGGGRPDAIQGTFRAPIEAIRETLSERLK